MKKKMFFIMFPIIALIIGASYIGYLQFFTDDQNSIKYGEITKNTIWEGNITVTGDIIVRPGVTLTVKPGTTITVNVGQDVSNIGQPGPMDDLLTGDPTYDPNAGGLAYIQSHIQIQVDGRIICKGTAEKPIIFKSNATIPHYTDWQGIYVNYGEFEYTSVTHSIAGIVCGSNFEKLTVEHCYIGHIWGAGIGFNNPKNPDTSSFVRYSTIEDCGHEAIDTHSPGNLEIAYNVVRSCQAGFNTHDLINANIHHNLVINTTFPVICVNASNVFITQCTFVKVMEQDTSRWTYKNYTLPRFTNAIGVFAAAGGISAVLITNSIIADAPVGLQLTVPGSLINNGYINFDSVGINFAGGVTQGNGIYTLNSGFEDEITYHLSDTSPLKDKGNPVDGNPELGAYGGANAQPVLGWQPDQ
jgi:hypothetical protein